MFGCVKCPRVAENKTWPLEHLILHPHSRTLRRSCSLNKRERISLAERSKGTPKKREVLMGERRDLSLPFFLSLPCSLSDLPQRGRGHSWVTS